MPRTYYILETCEDGALTELGAAVHEALLQKRWLDNDCVDRWVVWSPEHDGFLLDNVSYTSVEEMVNEVGLANVIPVGSVEFVSNFLKSHLAPLVHQPLAPIHALNIPPEISDKKYLDRNLYSFANKQELLDALKGISETHLKEQVLVKPGRIPKRFPAMTADEHHTYELENNVPDDEPLFVSEMLSEDIVSEWRVFCQRGRVVDIRPYILDKWVFPDEALVNELAGLLKDYPAITLDVAVLACQPLNALPKSNRTVVIEVHNFISCGLYGFGGPKILAMTKAAWKYELQLQNVR